MQPDVLDKFERRFYEFGKRIAVFDSIFLDFSEINKEFQIIKNNLKEIDFIIKSDSEKCDKFYQINSNKISDLEKKFDNLYNFLLKKEEDFSLQDKKISEIEKLEVDSRSKSEILRKNIFDLDQKINQILLFIRDFNEKTSNLEKRVSQNILDIQQITEVKKQIDHILLEKNIKENLFSDTQQIQFDLISKMREEFLREIKESNFLLEKRISETKNEIKNIISDIKIPSLENLVEKSKLDSTNARLDEIKLDIKNCILKSSNNELQLGIQSKKIDNIQLTLKQHDLIKQGS